MTPLSTPVHLLIQHPLRSVQKKVTKIRQETKIVDLIGQNYRESYCNLRFLLYDTQP